MFCNQKGIHFFYEKETYTPFLNGVITNKDNRNIFSITECCKNLIIINRIKRKAQQKIEIVFNFIYRNPFKIYSERKSEL